MSLLELAALLLLALAVIARFGLPRLARWIWVTATLALGLAVLANPARWQLWPAVAAIVLAGLLVWRSERFGWKTATAAVLLLALAAALAQLFALPTPPAPPGGFAVGTVTSAIDRPLGSGNRRLFVKIWYPARAAPGEPEGLWSDLPAMSDIPAPLRWSLAYLRHAPTHAHRRAPYAAGTAPRVVLYNHSFVSWASENSLLAEDLASRGFTVVAIRHLGQVAEYRALDRARRGPASDIAMALEIIRRRVADGRFVAGRLDSLLAAVPQMTRKATSGYAAMGFSLGGAISTDLCLGEPRCRAVVNLDGAIPGVDYARLPVPHYLLILGAGHEGVPPGRGGYERRTFPRAAHADFHDSAIALPLTRWVFGRSISVLTRERREQGELIAAFLDRAGL